MNDLSLWRAVRRYRILLRRVGRVLSKQSGKNALAAEWADRLATWAAELRAIRQKDTHTLIHHLARTRRAFGGMGSLNDVSVNDANVPREALFEAVNSLLAEMNGRQTGQVVT